MKSNRLYGSFSANRTTPEWKIRTSVYSSRTEDSFSYDDTTIDSTTKSQSLSGMIAKSLGEHWSIGAYISAVPSPYSNIKLSLTAAPAVEYDLFPYTQSTRRQLTFRYRRNHQPICHREETIYLQDVRKAMDRELGRHTRA